MSHRFKTAIIDDVVASNISPDLQDNLLDLFKYAMKSVATTLVREARFHTADFGTAKARGCQGFTLRISRKGTPSRTEWFGTFQCGNQHLDVIGHLE